MSSQSLANVAQSSKALSTAARIALASDLLSHGVVLFMLFRTFLFIFRRRQGEAGPGETPLLLKFWSNYGILHSFSLVLSQYLAPFGLSWVPSLFRAVTVLFISAGRRLPLSTHVYERATSPIHESAEPEVEQCLLQAREQWAQRKDELEEAARNLIDRAATGGVSSLVETKPSVTARTAPRDKLPEPVVPPAQTSQKFFAGQSERRVKTRAETSYKALRGVITSAQSEAPQPAYAASIAFRRAFRERRAQKEIAASGKTAATEE